MNCFSSIVVTLIDSQIVLFVVSRNLSSEPANPSDVKQASWTASVDNMFHAPACDLSPNHAARP